MIINIEFMRGNMSNNNKKIGAVIIAAGKRFSVHESEALTKVGSITSVRRIILTLQQVGVYPIVLVLGKDAEEVERQLAFMDVIFLRNEDYNNSEMFDSAKIGLNFIKDKCERVIFTRVDIPLVTAETIEKIKGIEKEIVSPTYSGKTGHPLLINSEIIEDILSYKGDDGMRGAIKNGDFKRAWIEVKDEGILYNVDELDCYDSLLENHNKQILHPYVKISIERENPFFDARAKLLLILLQDTASVKSACKQMALSYSNAWNIINNIEKELGYSLVDRKHGGKKGGETRLNSRGVAFLKNYIQYEKSVRDYANEEFRKRFL